MSFEMMKLVWSINDPGVTTAERLVLMALADQCMTKSNGQDRCTCAPGEARLSKMVNLSERQLRRVLTDLTAKGYIQTISKGGSISKRNTRYQINLF